jgi:septum formation protein
MEMHLKFILATNSPRRIELFKNICDEFEIYKQCYIEDEDYTNNPAKLVELNALNKARNACANILNNNCIIISADTVVVLKNRIYGKPENKEKAIKILKNLSSKSHYVYTGVSIILRTDNKIREINFVEKTKVIFNSIPEEDIVDYVNMYNPIDKAGAYGIQEIPSAFISSIDGDYDNIVGLPVKKLRIILKDILKNIY